MAAVLADYLAQVMRDGSSNCLTFVADWVALATGYDPAAEWRETMPDESVWLRMRGGRRRLAAEAMRPFPSTILPRPGDVGLVRVPMPAPRLIGIVGAICARPGQYAVWGRGTVTVAGPPVIVPVVMWRLPCLP